MATSELQILRMKIERIEQRLENALSSIEQLNLRSVGADLTHVSAMNAPSDIGSLPRGSMASPSTRMRAHR